jgi:hypothetical protein
MKPFLIILSLTVSTWLGVSSDASTSNDTPNSNQIETIDTFWSVRTCDMPNGDCGAECSNGNSDDCWESRDCKVNESISAILSSAFSDEELMNMARANVQLPPSIIAQLAAEGTLPIND